MIARTLSNRVKVMALSTVLGAGVLMAGAGAADAAPRGLIRPHRGPVQPVNRWMNDFDRDGIPNHRDRDIDNDGIPNARDRNDYTPLRHGRGQDWDRDGIRNGRDRDRDGDGVRNSRDRRPNDGRRR